MEFCEFILIIKSIVALYPKGATFENVKDEFAENTGMDFIYSLKDFYQIMLEVDNIFTYRDFYGNIYWRSTSPKTEHLRRLIREQKPQRSKPAAMTGCNFSLSRKPPRFAPYKQKPQRNFSRPSANTVFQPTFRNQDLYNPHLHGYHLMGDDFFLSVAKLELGFRLENGHSIERSGLCVSGQTVSSAIKRLAEMPVERLPEKLLINLGTVDLIHGRDVLDIRADYLALLGLCKSLGIEVIVTTLPPIGNFSSFSKLKKNWEKLNIFLRSQPVVIDICREMMQNDKILYSCYQGDARYVSGSNRAHVLWNKIGRQRILKSMKDFMVDVM